MSKRKHKKQQSKSNMIWIALAVIVVAAVGIFALQGSATADSDAISKIAPSEYVAQFSDAGQDHLLLDVRTPAEFAEGHIPGAVNISVESLASRLDEVPQDQTVVVYCRSGNRSATAANILADAGYSSIYDLGGIITWVDQGYPVQ